MPFTIGGVNFQNIDVLKDHLLGLKEERGGAAANDFLVRNAEEIRILTYAMAPEIRSVMRDLHKHAAKLMSGEQQPDESADEAQRKFLDEALKLRAEEKNNLQDEAADQVRADEERKHQETADPAPVQDEETQDSDTGTVPADEEGNHQEETETADAEEDDNRQENAPKARAESRRKRNKKEARNRARAEKARKMEKARAIAEARRKEVAARLQAAEKKLLNPEGRRARAERLRQEAAANARAAASEKDRELDSSASNESEEGFTNRAGVAAADREAQNTDVTRWEACIRKMNREKESDEEEIVGDEKSEPPFDPANPPITNAGCGMMILIAIVAMIGLGFLNGGIDLGYFMKVLVWIFTPMVLYLMYVLGCIGGFLRFIAMLGLIALLGWPIIAIWDSIELFSYETAYVIGGLFAVAFAIAFCGALALDKRYRKAEFVTYVQDSLWVICIIVAVCGFFFKLCSLVPYAWIWEHIRL